jgi:PelA/Pel-15E family pectate lyase
MASSTGIAVIATQITPALRALLLGLIVGAVLHANPAIAIDIVDASQPATDPQPHYNVPAGPKIGRYIDRPDSFFLSSDGRQFVDNLVGWQNPNGGWFKNISYLRLRPAVLEDNPNSGPPGDDDHVWHQVSTFDNGATYSEMRVLARAYRVLKDPKYQASFDRALDYCLAAQYPNGGWPQRYPLQKNYGARITFNDGAMTGVMAVLRDIYEQQSDFAFCSDTQRQQAKEAFDRGVNCILKCQYVQNGKLTVWGQQHDEHTFAPAGGRAFELAGLTANESADILELLEGVKNPDERIRNSIEAAYAWYESSKILGKRIDFVQGIGRTMVDDPTAPPLWARFYDPETNRPFVAGRDGVARARLDQISPERRNGYNWFSSASGRKAEEGYRTWKARFALSQPSAKPAQ